MIRPPDPAIVGTTHAVRHRYELIQRLIVFLDRVTTRDGHLAQVVAREWRGNCLPPSKGCTPGCMELREVRALVEPFRPKTERPSPRPIRPLPHIVLKPATAVRRAVRPQAPAQPSLFGEAV